MSMRVHTFAVAFLSVLAAASLAAQSSPNDVAAVTAVVERFHTALKTGDTLAASQLIADDAVFLEAGGVETRSEYVTNHLPADIEFEKTVTTMRGPIRVVVLGDAAWDFHQRNDRHVSRPAGQLRRCRTDGAQPSAWGVAHRG